MAQAPVSAAAAETIAGAEQAVQALAEEQAKAAEKARKTAEKQAAKKAKLKAEAEARAKAEVEKQLKAEQEQKAAAALVAKEAVEKKAREEAEKAQTEAKAKEKARIAAEKQAAKDAKLKAEAEARTKQEAEEKAVAEQKQKAAAALAAKAAAEKKAQEEAEQARAEAKAKEKARIAAEKQAAKDAKLKVEAEARAKVEAEEQAAREVKLKAEEETRAKQEAEDRVRAERKDMEKISRMTPEQRAAALKAKAEAREKAEKERKAVAEKAAKEAAEKKAKEEAEKKAKAEAQAKARKEAEKKAAEAEKAAKAEQEKQEREKKAAAGEKAPTVKESQAGAIDRWRFSVGLIRRTIGGTTMNTASYSQSYLISDKSGDSSSRFGDPGDLNSVADRNYENGYVRKDDYTDLDGGTRNWGYDSSGQVQDDTLSFRWKSREYTKFSRATTVTPAELDDGADHDAEAYLQAEYVVKKIGYVDCGVHLDLARTFFATGGNNFNTFYDSQEWSTHRDYGEDVYSLAGTGITPDSSPYHGDHDGPGPTIDNIPMDRRSGGTAEIDSGSYEAYNSIDQSLRINVSTLSFGLTLAGRYERVSLTGITGPTLNLVDTDATYQETLFESRNGRPASVLNSWSDRQDDSEYKLGYFVQGQLAVQAIRHLELGFFGRYDWAEKVTGSVGQSSYSINPEGGSVGGMATVVF